MFKSIDVPLEFDGNLNIDIQECYDDEGWYEVLTNGVAIHDVVFNREDAEEMVNTIAALLNKQNEGKL